MATIQVTKEHHLDHDSVKNSVQELADKLSEELSADYKWEGDRLVFKRSGANGFIEIGDGEVVLEIKLGMLLTPLKGVIESTVKNYMDERLS